MASTNMTPLDYLSINHSWVVSASLDEIEKLKSRPEVSRIFENRYLEPIEKTLPSTAIELEASSNSGFYAHRMIKIPEARQQFPHVLGQGVVVGHMDTGISTAHPIFKNNVDMYFHGDHARREPPDDTLGHGTHTAGIILQVAPKVHFVTASIGTSYASLLRVMQYFLDPDDHPDTPDQPRVINNSWNCQSLPDPEVVYRALDQWISAGVIPVFSAGNSGPAPQTISRPHEYPDVITVGGTDQENLIGNYSSRGPGFFRGQEIAKPELVAPGNDIYSSVIDGTHGKLYAPMTGTSMAAPFVTGAVALLLERNPSITLAQARETLIRSATPAGDGSPDHWSPAYGHGLLNVPAALK